MSCTKCNEKFILKKDFNFQSVLSVKPVAEPIRKIS